MRQHRKTWLLCTLLSIGLAGCGTNDEAANNGNRQENDMMRIGYYSNESHDNNGGNVRILNGNDNDGPATEMLDHTLGQERGSEKNNNGRRGANIQTQYDDPLIGANDRNYHGHLSNAQNQTGKKVYNRENQGNLSKEITQKVRQVENVKDAETIITEQRVLIGVLLEKNELVDETKKNIQNAVQPQLRGKQVQVFTNESQYNRIKVMNNDLKNGGPTKEIEAEINNIFNRDNR
ncbi:YhcN/YlaJ family sporulation lipoprotein [Niallia sp. Krafla_26]|uniref:YhcN/YlaJ family sporulation lipoprotein n=1 Tax=Niallia sp. Krafla_26 TaxID=3064703 RepID=UPI003D180157